MKRDNRATFMGTEIGEDLTEIQVGFMIKSLYLIPD